MRYMCFVQMAEDVGPAPVAVHEAMGAAMAAAFADGSMVDAGGLFPLAQSTEIRVAAGRVTTLDGPFAEAKEVVGGYAVINAASHAEAVAAARVVIDVHVDHWPGWQGSVQIRPITEPTEDLPD